MEYIKNLWILVLGPVVVSGPTSFSSFHSRHENLIRSTVLLFAITSSYTKLVSNASQRLLCIAFQRKFSSKRNILDEKKVDVKCNPLKGVLSLILKASKTLVLWGMLHFRWIIMLLVLLMQKLPHLRFNRHKKDSIVFVAFNVAHPAGTLDISYCFFEIFGNSDPVTVCLRSVSKPLFRPFFWCPHISHSSWESPKNLKTVWMIDNILGYLSNLK